MTRTDEYVDPRPVSSGDGGALRLRRWIKRASLVLVFAFVLWIIVGSLTPTRHVAVLVHVVDAKTGEPIASMATPSPQDHDRIHASLEPQPIHVFMWFGNDPISVTISAEGYTTQTVELDVGEATVKLEPLDEAGE